MLVLTRGAAHITLVAPRFEPSFFGYDYAMPVLGKKAMLLARIDSTQVR